MKRRYGAQPQMKSVLKGFGDISQTSDSGDLRNSENLLKSHQGTLDAQLARLVPRVYLFISQSLSLCKTPFNNSGIPVFLRLTFIF